MIAGCGKYGPGQESSAPERLIECKTMEAKEAGGERRVRSARGGKTAGMHDSGRRFERGELGQAGGGGGAARWTCM